MTDSVSDSSSTASPVTSTATASPHASSAGGAGAATTVSSMEDLKKKAPEVYNGMLQLLAQGMMNEQTDSQKRIHETNKELYSS